MASTTSAALLPRSANFDVFISHRGSDPKFAENVKEDLAIPLYHHLQDSFNVFLERFDLSFDFPSHAKLQALVSCDMGVIFISQGFVDGIFNGKAPWCLLELRVLFAKQRWLYQRELARRGIGGARPHPRIFCVAVMPFQIDDLWDGEHATTPLPLVSHTDLNIYQFELDQLKEGLAARDPLLVEFMEDPSLTLQKLLSKIPFFPFDGTAVSLQELMGEVKKRLVASDKERLEASDKEKKD